MGENIFSHFQTLFSFLLFLDTFSLILDPKVSINGRKRFLPFLDTFCRFSCFQTHFLLFQTQKCLEMGENGFSFSRISRHFLSFLLFLDTFSLILDPKVSRNGRKRFLQFLDTTSVQKCLEMGMIQKALLTRGPIGAKVSRNGNDPKSVTDAGPDRCKSVQKWE